MIDLKKLIETVFKLEKTGGIPPTQVRDEKDVVMLEQNGLYGEVVVEDVYKIKQFIPDVIFDIGANVGFFMRFARETFLDAKIVAVEPDLNNFEVLKICTNPDSNIVMINCAIGSGKVYRVNGAANGAMESYLSASSAIKEGEFATEQFIQTEIQSRRLSDIVKEHIKEGQTYALKIDCEGGENSIFDHPESVDCLVKADYIAMEVHNTGVTGNGSAIAKLAFNEVAAKLEITHHCRYDHPMFYARKK
jgi:FkbM family methyltransferase